MNRMLVAAVACGLACSSRAPAREPPLANAASERAAQPPRVADACADATAYHYHRETLERGREQEIAYGGLTGIYRGVSYDHYDDGTFAMLLQLELFGEPWLPDARDRGTHALGTHCVRLVSADDDRAVLDIAIQPAHAYDPSRCEMGCCPPGGSTAPDGTEECCFCSDKPRR